MQIAIAADGTTRFIHNDVLDAHALGAASVQRASHVLPQNRLLRAAFRWLRDTFGEKGIVAACTRRWPCLWMVEIIVLDSPVVLGPFSKRSAAINAEVQWLEKEYL